MGNIQYKLYRQLQLQLSCIRLVAASTVAGLLLGTAFLALAHDQGLISSASALTQENSTHGISTTAGDQEGPGGQGGSDGGAMRYRPDAHALMTSMFSWQATTRAIRCSYGLLVEGNIRACHAT